METQALGDEAPHSGGSGPWDGGTQQYLRPCKAKCSGSKNPGMLWHSCSLGPEGQGTVQQ